MGLNERTTIYTKLVELAELLGAEVLEVPFKHVDGLYEGTEDGPVIGIADKLSDKEKPHILAHEIGHLLLHDGDLITHRDQAKEDEATYLGERIIMLLLEEQARKYLREHGKK